MRVCILYGGDSAGNSNLRKLADGMSKGISSSGQHIVELIDMNLEQGRRVSSFDYIAIITQARGFFSKEVPPVVSTFLK